jgi:5-methyltetrahydrofolate--homocysteine methyltransferase
MDLLAYIQSKNIVLLDGAMGTRLDEAGLEMGGQNNVTHPQNVLDIHKEYAQCGCDILITNTLSMNRIYIETHRLDIDVSEVNLAGASLAKSAADDRQYVLGDIGSTAKLLEPCGSLAEKDAFEAFQEQASLLTEGGVDGFIIETMIDLKEALCALRACKAISSLPIMASMSFADARNGGRTIMGNSTRECVRTLEAEGVIAVGANCGDLGPSQMAAVIQKFSEETSLPLLCMPNAGIPKLVDNQTVFDLCPQSFAAGISECLDAGARLIGGCCGTTPAHIRALKSLV